MLAVGIECLVGPLALMERTDLQFTQDWSPELDRSLRDLCPAVPTWPVKVLEIGSFEGRGSRMLFERLVAGHAESRLYCVDPWDDAYVQGKTEFASIDPMFVGQFARFQHNTMDLGPRLIPMRGSSNEVLPRIQDEIDLGYIDGDHSPDQVYKDAEMVFRILKPTGVILFDDYLWEHEGLKTREGIIRWVRDKAGQVDVLFARWQVAVRKR